MKMLDWDFAVALLEAMQGYGWHADLPESQIPNPVTIDFTGESNLRLILYARPFTPQSSSESDHGRPSGEYHAQMIFEGAEPGQDSFLKFEDSAITLLFGFINITDTGYIVAAYDPRIHQRYKYSSSLQAKEELFVSAIQKGMEFHHRKRNNETVVIFHLAGIGEYIKNHSALHQMSAEAISEILDDDITQEERRTVAHSTNLPAPSVLEPSERIQRVSEIKRLVRDKRFSQSIIQIYERCAICGFQYDFVLEAAHIVPVAAGGTDTYDNGLGLCPNCHTMYDKGLILVDGDGKIYIHPQRAEEYDAIGRADSLASLKQSLREYLWTPRDPQHHPSGENLRKTFEARR